MSNSKAVQRLRVIELSGDFSEKAASGAVVVQDPIHSFFDRLLDGDLFECAVVVAKKGLLSRKDQTAWPLVIASEDDAKSARVDLEQVARAGFQLIVGTKSSLGDLETVFGLSVTERLGKERTLAVTSTIRCRRLGRRKASYEQSQ